MWMIKFSSGFYPQDLPRISVYAELQLRLLRKHVAKSTFYVVVEILTAFISLVTVVLGFAQTQTVELLYSAINSPTY